MADAAELLTHKKIFNDHLRRRNYQLSSYHFSSIFLCVKSSAASAIVKCLLKEKQIQAHSGIANNHLEDFGYA